MLPRHRLPRNRRRLDEAVLHRRIHPRTGHGVPLRYGLLAGAGGAGGAADRAAGDGLPERAGVHAPWRRRREALAVRPRGDLPGRHGAVHVPARFAQGDTAGDGRWARNSAGMVLPGDDEKAHRQLPVHERGRALWLRLAGVDDARGLGDVRHGRAACRGVPGEGCLPVHDCRHAP